MTVESVPESASPIASWLLPFQTSVPTDEDGKAEEIVRCSKCQSKDTITEYHPMAASGFRCWDEVQNLRMAVNVTEEEFVSLLKTEHLCRSCLSCNYCWCERTADAN